MSHSGSRSTAPTGGDAHNALQTEEQEQERRASCDARAENAPLARPTRIFRSSAEIAIWHWQATSLPCPRLHLKSGSKSAALQENTRTLKPKVRHLGVLGRGRPSSLEIRAEGCFARTLNMTLGAVRHFLFAEGKRLASTAAIGTAVAGTDGEPHSTSGRGSKLAGTKTGTGVPCPYNGDGAPHGWANKIDPRISGS